MSDDGEFDLDVSFGRSRRPATWRDVGTAALLCVGLVAVAWGLVLLWGGN